MTLRWPLCLRSTYDDLRRDLADERQRTRELTDTVVSMKMQGAVIVRPMASQRMRESVVAIPKSAIEQAVDENKHAQRNSRLRAHLIAQAQKKIERGIPEETVLDELHTWDQVSADQADDDEIDDIEGPDADEVVEVEAES